MLTLIAQLRAQRHAKKISQRELSSRSGITQSHISLIEQGAIDPGLSTFIELARSMELEAVLVPRHYLPIIESLLKTSEHATNIDPNNQPLFSLNEEDDDN